MTFTDATSAAAVPGYKFIGQTRDGLWGKFVEDNRQDWTLQQRDCWRQQQKLKRQQRATEEEKRRAAALPAVERDRLYQNLLDQLSLHPTDQADLKRRGLTDEQIATGGFKSVEQWQHLESELPHQLPGVNLDGLSLNTQPGYLCPIKDVNGLIVGCQIHLRDANDGGRYRWLTSATKKRPNRATPHLWNGELPLAVHRPEEVKLASIGMTEGTGAKPFIASQRLNQAVIGAAGGLFATSPQTLKATLEKLSAQLGNKTVNFYVDAGDVQNPNVIRRNRKTWDLLQQWGYTVQIAWWGQAAKDQPDIDELDDLGALAYISTDDFLSIVRSHSGSNHRCPDFGSWLFKLKQRIAKPLKPKGWVVSRKGEVKVEPTTAKSLPTIEYQPGERLEVWATTTKQKYKYILDTSATGTGKSFYAGMATPELFTARQLIYVSHEHRNPAAPTLKSWVDLEAKHGGLVRDEFGKLRRANKGQSYVVSPNCGLSNVVTALRAKNIQSADSSKLICQQACPYLNQCRAGTVYGYLYDRAKSLSQPRLRAHPDSLPSPDEYDYSNVDLIWDEASEILKVHRSIEVRAVDLQRAIADLAVKLPDVFDNLRLLLSALHPYLLGTVRQQSKYGWKDAQIRQALPQLNGIDIKAIAATLKPDLSLLNATAEYGVESADLPHQVRKKFSESNITLAEQVNQSVPLDWLTDFLSVLQGNLVGHLRIEYGKLIITVADPRHTAIAQAAKANIFLDATAHPEDLARMLGCDPSEILVVRQQQPDISNLEIIQVATMGRLGIGSDRSEFCQKRVDAIINQIEQDTQGKVAVFDFKRHTTPRDGKRHWWIGSRGINDLEDCDALVLVGVPCRNLNDLGAEFTVLYGRSPKEGTERVKYPIQVNGQLSADLQPWFEMEMSADSEFRAFVRRHILADIHQGIGRLRAHWRLGKQLKVYLSGDYPLDVPVTLRKASSITSTAATKVERVEMAIQAAVQQLKEAGQKITQQAIAAITGYSQSYLSQRFRELLLLLLDPLNSKSNNSDDSPEELEFVQDVSLVLASVANESPPTLLECLNDIFYSQLERRRWQQVWDFVPADAQIKIMTALALTLPPNQLQELVIYD